MHSGILMLCPPENAGIGIGWNLQIPSPAWIARAGTAFQPQALTIQNNKYKNIDKAYRLCIFRCIISLPYEVTHFRVYCQQTYYTPKCFIRHFLLKTCKVVYLYIQDIISIVQFARYHLNFLKIFIRFQYQIVEILSCPCLLEYRQPPFPNFHFEILRIPQKRKVFRLLWLYRNYP